MRTRLINFAKGRADETDVPYLSHDRDSESLIQPGQVGMSFLWQFFDGKDVTGGENMMSQYKTVEYSKYMYFLHKKLINLEVY